MHIAQDSNLSNANETELRAIASRARAVELKLLWQSIRIGLGKMFATRPQPATSTTTTQQHTLATANDEYFQKAA